MLRIFTYLLLLIGLLIHLLNGVAQPEAVSCDPDAEYSDFADPQRVTIQGYGDDAMEAFLSRDGHYLFFNNRNVPAVDTNLHWARRIDDLTFDYMGEIEGVATPDLEGVPTMDHVGRFYFVSTRSYNSTLSTLYTGYFDEGALSDVRLVPGVSREVPGLVNFDVEVSPYGEHLYFVDARFDQSGQPQTADLVIAERQKDGFGRLADSDELMQYVNTEVLEYAAAISADEQELFFTRVDFQAAKTVPPQIYRAYREDTDAPFGCPARVSAIEGFVEAATFSPDEQALYYHKLENQRFAIYRVTRP